MAGIKSQGARLSDLWIRQPKKNRVSLKRFMHGLALAAHARENNDLFKKVSSFI
jgi:hypothetical protein